MNHNKVKKKCDYTIIGVPSIANQKIKHLNLSRTMINVISTIAVLIVVFVIILGMMSFYLMTKEKAVGKVGQQMEEKLYATTEENDLLKKHIDELDEKIVILSDTINQRVEEDQVIEAAENEKYVPGGFPLGGTATMEEPEQGETPTEPMLLFKANEGTAVIASGAGTVIECIVIDNQRSVKIDHNNGYLSIYQCASDYKVQEGQPVDKGTILFSMTANEEMLKYQIMLDGKLIDPLEIMEIDG